VNFTAVVLAAGLGKRMKSSLPKVLHRLHGISMLQYVVDALKKLRPRKIIVVVGKHFREIRESLEDIEGISFAEQSEAKGTGDALLRALPHLSGERGTVIVINGDAPLITPETLRRFLALHEKRCNDLSIISFVAGDPKSYGRLKRDQTGNVVAVVEDRDAAASEKMIREVNSGVYAMEPEAVHLLREIKLNESKGEYYLTDIVRLAREKGMGVDAFRIGSEDEFIGVNTMEELAKAGRLMKERMIKGWMDRGVNFIDAGSVYISANTYIGRGTVVYPNVHLEGNTRIGRDCVIHPNVRICESIIGDGVVIKDSTLIESSVVKKNASVGPFAHIRPGSEIGANAKIGNFVEVKKSVIGDGTKASHLSYLGDARIGRDVNIGAGTITCNYDGHTKHVTTLGDGVFIGSDSQLIAPVRVGKGAYVGAGSTITKDVPPKALALSRVEQVNIKGWATKRQLKVKGGRRKAQSAKRQR
jgi:bifunctional UDP-N-acetylglucosamine pyrophosphorylase/glucosamine-1-phosphate N-acetyltransferase